MRRKSTFKILPVLLLFCAFIQGNAQNKKQDQHQFSLVDELQSLNRIWELPLFRQDTRIAQVSSYDTTGGNDDGFSGKYSFVRRNPDSSLVIFDVKGSGVINRIWTPTPTDDTLDFYIDDTTKPVLSIMYSDLFSGKVYPFVQPLCGNQLGGYFCYFPILFQNSCRIVCRAKKLAFHQIQYRLYPAGTVVQAFEQTLGDAEKNSLLRIAALWNKASRSASDFVPQGSAPLLTSSNTSAIKRGETKRVFTLNEGGRISGIEFEQGSNKIDKDLDIRITWDDEVNPAVYCPLADFFGHAFGEPSMQSLLLGSENNRNYIYFPMPFDKKATIELIYRKNQSAGKQADVIQFKTRIYYSKLKRDREREGKFYTCWQSTEDQPGHPHEFLKIRGKGHYVGTLLQAQGLQPGMTYFFEGDDSTSIDGDFRVHGTGSEDYFNGGWYAFVDRWDSRMSMPIHGSLDYSLPFSRTGGYRFFLSDKMSFEKSIYHSIEHGPTGNNMPSKYTSLAFYYCDAPVAEYTKPTNELSRVYIPDTLVIYPQLMNLTIWGDIESKPVWAYNTGGQSFVFTVNDESRVRIQLDRIPPGKYKLYADFQKFEKGCQFSLWQRQTQLSEWISTYDPGKERKNLFYLNDLVIREFLNSITIRFKTESGKSSLFLNRLILVRQPPGKD